jgi:hypothetical protein
MNPSSDAVDPISRVCAGGRWMARWAVLALGATMLLAAGCSRAPQVSPKNRRLIESLRTAVTSRNAQWLEDNARIVEERRTSGHMQDAEYVAFQTIVTKAREGDWADAQSRALNLLKAQQPLPEELEKLKAVPKKQ